MSRFEVFQDNKKEWRWRFVSRNSRIIAVASEGYKTETDCVNGIRLMQEEAAGSPINRAA